MDARLLQLALNNLLDEVERLKSRLHTPESEMELIRSSAVKTSDSENRLVVADSDELMDIKEVQSKLWICYNSLNKLVKQGLLKPIKINQRRIRFRKQAIYDFIKSQV